MLSIIQAQTHNIFARTRDRRSKLCCAQVLHSTNRGKYLDLAERTTCYPVQDSLQNLLPLFVVADEVKHMIGANDSERSGCQVNIEDLIVLHNTYMRLWDGGSRKADKFHRKPPSMLFSRSMYHTTESKRKEAVCRACQKFPKRGTKGRPAPLRGAQYPRSSSSLARRRRREKKGVSLGTPQYRLDKENHREKYSKKQ